MRASVLLLSTPFKRKGNQGKRRKNRQRRYVIRRRRRSVLHERETGKSAGVDIDWSEDFLNAKRDVKDCGVEISEDYSLIIQGPDDDGSFYTFLLPACIYMQIFEGKQVDEIKVTCVEVDESGNVIDEIKWELPPDNQS